MFESDPNPFLVALMAALRERYSPAKSIADADVYLTTKQIAEALKDIYPYVELGELAEMIYGEGFKIENIGQMQLAWLMKYR